MIKLNRHRQCAALPYRVRENVLSVLLVTSIRTKRWVLPKGNIEPGLTARESAEFEALEEAGVVGVIAMRRTGTYTYRKSDEKSGLYQVIVFPLEVERELETYPESKLRIREWVSIETAADRVAESDLKELLLRFARRLKVSC
ncbi:MAG: NUDIX hydrolase [Alphaproteobacteria bacterium]|nr:NUDIX hydrolase [Alphaproteobacteria bacterium]